MAERGRRREAINYRQKDGRRDIKMIHGDRTTEGKKERKKDRAVRPNLIFAAAAAPPPLDAAARLKDQTATVAAVYHDRFMERECACAWGRSSFC